AYKYIPLWYTGESSPTRREAVKRKTSEYLMRAEKISSLYCRPSSEDGSIFGPPGSLSSRPSWNLRSPAEELKAFRVLGVIDKVILQCLFKSSVINRLHADILSLKLRFLRI
ncbi:hypothetical protein E2320_019228, partial [Naja naja]